MTRKILLILCLMVGLAAVAKTYSPADVPNVQVQDHTKHFSNPDGIVSDAVAQQIDTLLADARRQSSAEIVAVIVDDIDPGDIDEFATQLFRKWGVGKKDKNNGIVILVAKDRHDAVIRTGYGAEGVLPDILAGRILRNQMFPHFRNGDYDSGMLAAVQEVHRLVTDPEAVAELMSAEKDKRSDNFGASTAFNIYLTICIIIALIMLILLVSKLVNAHSKKLSDYEKYLKLKPLKAPYLALTFFGIGIPLVATLPLVILLNFWRNKPRKCASCGAKMRKLDEATDNQYLTAAQDLEEQLNSVDYDVWLCPDCGQYEALQYVNDASSYETCPKCFARTLKLSGVRDIVPATVSHAGQGEKIYTCLNCHNRTSVRYKIPKKEVPVVVVPSGFSGGRGGGGGSFGGGFGGGFTGGGGASGHW